MSELANHSERAHALLSASSAYRWTKCPPSAAAAEMYPAQDTEFTREGTLAHEVAEWVARKRAVEKRKMDFRVSRETGITQEMLDCAAEYADYLQELITDDNAVVLLEQRLDFSPWVPEGFGTGDCVIIQGNRLDVVDYKYGQGVAVSAKDNPQMRLYALGALNDYGAIYDVREVGMHIFQPRMNNVSVDAMQVQDLQEWGRSIEAVAKLAAKGEGDFCSGEHCRFCPHAGACPSLTASCLRVVNLHGGTAAVPTLAPWMVADILGQEPIISAWLKAVKDRALAALLNGEEVPGYKVVEGRGSRVWSDDSAVIDVLAVDGGYSRAQIMTQPELLSPYQLEKAIGKKKVAELVGSLIVSKPGNPTVAPAADKRKAFDRLAEAVKDFE